MEPKYKVSYMINKDYIKNLYLYLCFLRPFRIICNIIFILYLIQGVYELVVYGYFSIVCLVLAPLFLVYGVFSYFRGVSLNMKRYKEMNNENCVVNYEFYDDYIKFVSSNGSNSTIQYTSMRKLVKTKKLVVLISKARLAYWFPIDSFEIGNLDELKSFLRSKGVKVKR